MRLRTAGMLVSLAICAGPMGCASLAKNRWGGDGKVVQTAEGLCLELTPEAQEHRVAVCESPDQKSFAVIAPGRAALRYPKLAVQTALKDRLYALVRATPYPARELADATVELWVVAPVFAPQDAYFTAFVQAKGGNFSVRLPLEARDWAPDVDDVALFGKESFPSRTARRAGKVVVTARSHVTAADFERFLADNGLHGVNRGGLVELDTGAFGEEQAARVLLKARHAAYFVQGVELTPAGEKDGAKARAFAFPMRGS